MTAGNLEIVKRGIESFNAEGIDGVVPMLDPDFEATTPPELDFGQEAVMVWELRDGRATRLSLYPTVHQALSAVEQESSA